MGGTELKRLFFAFGAALAAATLSVATPALADYPEKDVRTIVPWGAGGGADGIARKFMSIAEKNLGGTIYVENIEGGLSSIGINEVMKSRPDGYTIGALTYDSIITVPWRKLLPGYDLSRLKLLARITSEPNALMVGKGKYADFAAFIEAAKAAPNKVTVGVHGLGSMPHLSLLQMQDETGAQFRAIAYPDGAAGQKEALLSGEVDAVITSLGDFAPLLQAEQAVGLVEFSDTKNATYSSVPISSEVGLEMTTGSFIVLATAANTPDDVVSKLETAFKAAFDTAEFQEWTKGVGVTASWLGVADVATWVDEVQTTIFGQLDSLAERKIIEK